MYRLDKYKPVIFVYACFRHGHENYSYFKLPKTRTKNSGREKLKKEKIIKWEFQKTLPKNIY